MEGWHDLLLASVKHEKEQVFTLLSSKKTTFLSSLYCCDVHEVTCKDTCVFRCFEGRKINVLISQFQNR